MFHGRGQSENTKKLAAYLKENGLGKTKDLPSIFETKSPTMDAPTLSLRKDAKQPKTTSTPLVVSGGKELINKTWQ